MIIDEKVDPTCTTTGLTEGSHCSRCDHKVEQTIIPKLGHNFKDVVTLPTCEEQGYTTHTCERCNDTYIDSYVNELGHIASDWIIDKQATENEYGSKHKECTNCKEILDEETIPMIKSSGCNQKSKHIIINFMWCLSIGLYFIRKRK